MDCEVLGANFIAVLHRVMLFTCIKMCLMCCFLGVPLGSFLRTSKCMQMLPRLIKGIYRVQENCVKDLGIRCPLLSLVVLRGYPEGQLLCAFSKLLVFAELGSISL